MTIDELVELLATGAAADDGEPVSLLEHSLQCAHLVAQRSPGDLVLQAAALVHDIGTVAAPDQPATHAATGAAIVEELLGRDVADLVAAHDHAKRYLVSVEPAYGRHLSPQSTATLRAQGGTMGPEEIAAFAARADRRALLELRRADDAAKRTGALVPALDAWRPVLDAVANRHR